MGILRAFVMGWAFLAGVVGTGLIGPLRSSVQSAFGLDTGRFGLWLATVQFAASGLVLMAAPRLRTLGPLRLLMSGLGVMTAGLATCAAMPGIAGWLGGWALVCVGLSLSTITNNVSMDLWPHDRRRGVVFMHAWNGGGKVAGPLVAAAAMGWMAAGWRGGFSLAGVLTAGWLAWFALSGRQDRRSFAASDGSRPETGGRGWGIFASGLYWRCVLPFAAIAGSEAAFATLAPLFFETARGFSRASASILFTVHLTGLMTGRFLVAFRGGRAENNHVIAWCLAAGLALPAVLWLRNPVALGAALWIYGLTFSATWPTFYAQAAQFLPKDRTMLAYGASLANLAGIAGCILLSSQIAVHHLPAALWFSVAVMWAFGAWFFVSSMSRPPREESRPHNAAEELATERKQIAAIQHPARS